MIDNSDFARAARALIDASNATHKQTVAVVKRGAMNIKKQMNAELAASTHFSGIAGSVTYDIREGSAFGGGFVEAEIGPDHNRKGGALANVAYFGTSRGGGTVADPQQALDAEAPRFEAALLKIMGDVL